MRTKKTLAFIGILLIGSIATAVVDVLVGVSFKDVGAFAELVHKVAYMVWGGVIVNLARRV